MIGEETKARLRAIVARYPVARSAMLPCLHLVQEEQGYVTPEGILAVAEAIGVKPDEVESIVTFYSMYHQEPVGRMVIKVCTSISCYLHGCDDVMANLERRLGVRRGQTTPDGRFTLEGVECLAACGMAPALQVNGEFAEQITPAKTDALVDALERDGVGALRDRWRMIADGRGMATETTLDGGRTPGAGVAASGVGQPRADDAVDAGMVPGNAPGATGIHGANGASAARGKSGQTQNGQTQKGGR
jgi:NADH-quinone oxidoreductase E subunit